MLDLLLELMILKVFSSLSGSDSTCMGSDRQTSAMGLWTREGSFVITVKEGRDLVE